MSTPVAFSSPSNPGELFTSMILGPPRDSSMSTPATSSPMTRAAFTAASAYSRGSSMADNVLWPEAVAPDSRDVPFVGDANGDGKADIIVFARAQGKVYVSLAR